jgi:hypothetical protein
MYAKGKNKATKGTVQIKTSNGRLQLVFSHPIVAEDGEIKNKRFYWAHLAVGGVEYRRIWNLRK